MPSTCTIEDILAAVRKVDAENRRPESVPFVVPPTFNSFLNMRIVEVPDRLAPILKLRDTAPVTDAFRQEFDAWLLEMFGTRDDSVVPRGMAYMFADRIVMRRSDAVVLANTAV